MKFISDSANELLKQGYDADQRICHVTTGAIKRLVWRGKDFNDDLGVLYKENFVPVSIDTIEPLEVNDRDDQNDDYV